VNFKISVDIWNLNRFHATPPSEPQSGGNAGIDRHTSPQAIMLLI